ncbi:MAG TPA: hypothetical protein VIO57_09795, partial [Chloroflexota bacterium]
MSTTTRRRAQPKSRADTRDKGLHPVIPSIVALLLCLAALAAAFAGIFKVKTIQVVGSGLPQARILAVAGLSGANIFSVRSDEVVA